MDYSDRLLLAMQSRGVDRQALATALGISVAAVGLVLNRKSKMFDAINHCRAAHRLGVDPLWLATGRGEMLHPATSSMTSNPPALPDSLQVVLERLPGLDEYSASKVMTALQAAMRATAPLDVIEQDLLALLQAQPRKQQAAA